MERQLASSQSRYHELEDTVLHLNTKVDRLERAHASELQVLRAKQIDSDSRLTEAVKAKEVEYLISRLDIFTRLT